MTTMRDQAAAGGREWTGLRVLLWLLGFFGVIMVANGAMVHYALSTFGGVETESAYAAGLRYQADIEAAARQAKLGWQISTEVRDLGEEARELGVRSLDAEGVPLRRLEIEAMLRHPIDSRLDHPLAFTETAPGLYVAEVDAAAGQWELDMALAQDGETRFRSENRLILR
ncbi:MAG TPA: FixH family protein [Geminicoccaceae bacterium]|nr:FixH family protein [Geminicoccus sp.]HMU52654.1 FixH family protein [Geminicoccaceae bacterium]